MKKTAHITFIFLAALFAFKSITVLITLSEKQLACCEMNMNETGSSEENEKNDVKEKELSEEGKLPYSTHLSLSYQIANPQFSLQKEKWQSMPYFEVCSPPPELI